MMKCSIIQDLLPLYVDGVVSVDTAQAVEEHLETCETCRKAYEQMEQTLKLPANPDLQQESCEALKAVKQTLRWKRIAVAATSALLTFVLVVSGYMVFQNVGVVHDFFDPMQWVSLRDNQTDDWQTLQFRPSFSSSETTALFQFDNLFYSRNVVNDTSSKGSVSLRFRDAAGKVAAEVTELPPGTSASLQKLQRFTAYTVEIQTAAADVFLTFT